jgi:hypothetical protein
MKNTEMNIKKETPIDGGTITLQKPIEINGKAVSELPYDINEITVDLLETAEVRASRAGRGPVPAEIDNALFVQTGFAAIIACNPEIDWADLARIKGTDIAWILRIGRSFFTASAGTQEVESGQSEVAQSESV